MTDTVICEGCKKEVSKKYAIYISLMGKESTRSTVCLDCEEETENNFQKGMHEREQEMIREYGYLDRLYQRMQKERLKSHEEFKEMMKELRGKL